MVLRFDLTCSLVNTPTPSQNHIVERTWFGVTFQKSVCFVPAGLSFSSVLIGWKENKSKAAVTGTANGSFFVSAVQ